MSYFPIGEYHQYTISKVSVDAFELHDVAKNRTLIANYSLKCYYWLILCNLSFCL